VCTNFRVAATLSVMSRHEQLWRPACYRDQSSFILRRMVRHSVCFLDADPLELRRFKKVCSDRFDIGIGRSTSEALRDFDPSGKRKPDLLLLDMYLPDSPLPSESDVAQLHKAREKFLRA
jgi:hypothetical protein